VSDGLGPLDAARVHDRLGRARIARLAYVDGDEPVVVPVNVLVDGEQRVVFHAAADGPLAALHGRRVGVEVDGFDEGERTGWSILVHGVARDVTEADDLAALVARRAAVDCWAPGRRDRVMVVLALAITGREITVGRDGWFAGVPAS
jgi:hypothetical protein